MELPPSTRCIGHKLGYSSGTRPRWQTGTAILAGDRPHRGFSRSTFVHQGKCTASNQTELVERPLTWITADLHIAVTERQESSKAPQRSILPRNKVQICPVSRYLFRFYCHNERSRSFKVALHQSRNVRDGQLVLGRTTIYIYIHTYIHTYI